MAAGVGSRLGSSAHANRLLLRRCKSASWGACTNAGGAKYCGRQLLCPCKLHKPATGQTHTHTHEDQQTLTASRVVAHAATAPQPFSQLPQSFGRAHEQTLTHCHKHTHTPYHLLLLLLGKQPSYFLWHALHRGVYNRGGGKGRERGTWRPARAHLGMQG